MAYLIPKLNAWCTGLKTVLLLVLVNLNFCSFGQSVDIKILILPPYPNNAQDLMKRQFENIIELTNRTNTTQQVQLNFRIYSDDAGVGMKTKDGVRSPNPITIPPMGSTRLSAGVLESYFSANNLEYYGITLDDVIRKRTLPEGFYFVCAQAFDYSTGVSLSPESCSNPIALMALEPPSLRILNPVNKDTIKVISPQNIIFQWNTPSNLPATVSSKLEYTLKLVEVAPGVNINHAMQSAPSSTPEYKIIGSSVFVYGPSRTPLIPGKRYAAMLQIQDPSLAYNFRNNGKSPVISFVFGSNQSGGGTKDNKKILDETTKHLHNIAYGTVFNGFFQTPGIQGSGPLSVDEKGKLQPRTFRYLPVVQRPMTNYKVPMIDTRIVIYTKSSAVPRFYSPFYRYRGPTRHVEVTLGVGKTDKNGNFIIRLNTPAYRLRGKTLYAKIYSRTGVKNVQLRYNLTHNKFQIEDIVFLNSATFFKPMVFENNPEQGSKLKVRVLERSAIVQRTPFLKQLADQQGGKTFLYHGVSYTVIQEFNKSEYKPLYTGRYGASGYIVQVSKNEGSYQYYPIGATRRYAPPNRNFLLNSNYIFQPVTSFTGSIVFQDVPRRDVRIRIKIARNQVLGNAPKGLIKGDTFVFEGISDLNGYYAVSAPLLADGATVHYEVFDRTIRTAPWKQSKVLNSGQLDVQENFVLVNQLYLVLGRVHSTTSNDFSLGLTFGNPEDNAVSNAQVKDFEGKFATRTGTDGHFISAITVGTSGKLVLKSDERKDVTTPNLFSSKFNGSGERLGINEKVKISTLKKGQTLQNLTGEVIEGSLLTKTLYGKDLDGYSSTVSSLKKQVEYLQKTTRGEIIGIIDAGDIFMENQQGKLALTVNSSGVIPPKTKVLIEFSNGFKDTIPADQEYSFQAAKGSYHFTVSPLNSDRPFLPVKADFELNTRSTYSMGVFLSKAAYVTGKVFKYIPEKDQVTKETIDSVKIEVKGTENFAYSNLKGEYKLYVPLLTEVTLSLTKSGYNTTEHTEEFRFNATRDLSMSEIDTSLPSLKRMLGYNIYLDKFEKNSSGSYTISGKLALANSGLYSVVGSDSLLPFVDVAVKMDEFDKQNCIPLMDVSFDRASLDVNAYGWLPVKVLGKPTIELRTYNSTLAHVKNKGTVGGKLLLIDHKRIKIGGILPFNMKNAYLTLDNKDKEYLKDKIKLGDALTDKEKEKKTGDIKGLMSGSDFEYIFVTPGTSHEFVKHSNKFNLTFSKPDFEYKKKIELTKKDTSKTKTPKYVKEDYVNVSMGLVTSIVHKYSASVDSLGMNLNGFIKLPDLKVFKWPNKGLITTEEFVIGKQFEIKKIVMSVKDSNALEVPIQKWELMVNKLMLFGLGTTNVGVGFGGKLFLKKDENGNKNEAEALTIKELSLVRKSSGVTLTGDFILPDKGITVSKLNFTTPPTVGRGAVRMSYNHGEKSFFFNGSGRLKYTATGLPGESSVLAQIFPVDIETFVFKSKDWSFLLSAKSDISVDLKVLDLNISRFLINIGYPVTLDYMSSIMKRDADDKKAFLKGSKMTGVVTADSVAKVQRVIENIRAAGKTPPKRYTDYVNQQIAKGIVTRKELKEMMNMGVGAEDKLLHAKAVSWAVGIQGDINFDVKGIETKAGGTLLVAQKGSKVNVKINEILLNVTNPSFHLAVEAKMAFGPKKNGLEGMGDLELLKRSFAASFKFYHHAANLKRNTPAGVEMGASLMVSTAIVTGPVLWHAIGGGFDLNTVTQKYKVYAIGEMGPAATPKALFYLDKVKLSVLFDTKKCGAAPIVEGTASMVVKNETWGVINAKADFCRSLILVTLNNDVSVLEGVSKVRLTGLLYGIAPKGNFSKGQIFFGLNAKVNVKNFMSGNGLLAAGINFDKNHPLTPAEIKNMWRNIDKEALEGRYKNRLNALYVDASLTVPKKTGTLDISIADYKALGFKYDFYGKGDVVIYKSFSTSKFYAKAHVTAEANARLSFLTFLKLSGSAKADVSLDGGYNHAWYLKGKGSLSVKMNAGLGASCNTVKIHSYYSKCWYESYCSYAPVKWKYKWVYVWPVWVKVWYPTWPCKRWSKRRVCDLTSLKVEYGMKVCKTLGVNFDIKEGRSPKFNFSI